VTTTFATQGASPATRHRLAIRGGVEAGLLGAATLLLIRVVVAGLFALAVAPFTALVRAYLYLTSSTPADSWLMRLAHSPFWLALKVGAYPYLGERVLEPGFDLRVILIGAVAQLVTSIGWGVLLGLLTVGRAATTALPVGLLLGIAAWYVNGYVLPAFFGGGTLAAGPELLIEFIPYGLAMAVSFVHYEHAHSLATGHHGAPGPLHHLVEKPAR
jgi:hypothetical protein